MPLFEVYPPIIPAVKKGSTPFKPTTVDAWYVETNHGFIIFHDGEDYKDGVKAMFRAEDVGKVICVPSEPVTPKVRRPRKQ